MFHIIQPSSCLSDKEEDEIYGFGYGVFAPRIARGALQSLTNPPLEPPPNNVPPIQQG